MMTSYFDTLKGTKNAIHCKSRDEADIIRRIIIKEKLISIPINDIDWSKFYCCYRFGHQSFSYCNRKYYEDQGFTIIPFEEFYKKYLVDQI